MIVHVITEGLEVKGVYSSDNVAQQQRAFLEKKREESKKQEPQGYASQDAPYVIHGVELDRRF